MKKCSESVETSSMQSSRDLQALRGYCNKDNRSGSALDIRNSSTAPCAFHTCCFKLYQTKMKLNVKTSCKRCHRVWSEAHLKSSELSGQSKSRIIFEVHRHQDFQTIQSGISTQFKLMLLCWYGGALMLLAWVTYTCGKTPSVQKSAHRFQPHPLNFLK